MQLLLGTDGSTYSRLAEQVLLRIPEWRQANVTVASVSPSASYSLSAAGPMASEAAQQLDAAVSAAARNARDFAQAAVQRLTSKGVKATTAFLEGDPGQELLNFAERNRFDAIAIGSRGMGAFQSMLLGSVARVMVSHAPCHVLIARSSRGLTPEQSLDLLKADPKLVATLGTDGSEGARVAVEFLKRQGPGAFEKIVVVAAEPICVVPAGIDPSTFTELYRYDHERAVAVSNQAAEELAGCAEEVTATTGLGRPAHVVNEKANEAQADLIVVGATCHGTLERFLIGSVSYELATEAPCSTLIVRPPVS